MTRKLEVSIDMIYAHSQKEFDHISKEELARAAKVWVDTNIKMDFLEFLRETFPRR